MADALVPVVISEDERDQQDESMMKVEVQQAVDSKKQTNDNSDALVDDDDL